MGGAIRPPDDVPRAPSGRVPQWVIDEARGIEPTDRVPFRGPTTSVLSPPRRSRARQGLKVVGALTLVVAVLAVAGVLGLASPLPGVTTSATQHASPTPTWIGPPLGHEESKHPLGRPEPLVGKPSTRFRFEEFQADGTTPVTWSPCRPIHYVVRPDHAPRGGAQLLAEAFARLHRATGLVFVNDGRTREDPTQDRRAYQWLRYGNRWAPVLVTWATPDEVPDFGVDIVGEAGAQREYTESGDYAFVTGTVALDAQALATIAHRRGAAAARAVVLHELGHLVGLAHVNDARQIMFPRTGRAMDYSSGDLAGLAQLGTGPCRPDV
jgi:hypothetical protein